MPDDEYGKPTPTTWEEAKKDAGSEDKARLAYPTLDPEYQKLVKEHGEAKGIEMYSKQYIDPITLGPAQSEVQQIGENLPGSTGYAEALQRMKKGGGLGADIADVGGAMLGATSAFSKATIGHPLPADEGGPGPSSTTGTAPAKPKATTPAVNPISPAAQAANQMMQALAGEYQGEMAAVEPYMSGQAGEAANAGAEKMGQSIGGPGVQGQNPAYAAALAGPQQNVANAAAAGSADITQGIKDLGTADEAYMATAPYQGLLSALQSEGQYKIETGAATPNVAGTPNWAQAAYADVLGSAPAGASSATTPTSQSQLAAQQAAQTSPSTDNQSAPGAAGGSA